MTGVQTCALPICYDPEKGRVIYQPVTIEPREITPRIIREEHYGNSEGFRKG